MNWRGRFEFEISIKAKEYWLACAKMCAPAGKPK
jgi:hypothetical protein